MLVIKNKDKILGDTFLNGRFLCSNFQDTNDFLSFWFKDLTDKIPTGGIWIGIDKKGKWSVEDNEMLYTILYPNSNNKHYISANWFSDIDNARRAFQIALEETINK